MGSALTDSLLARITQIADLLKGHRISLAKVNRIPTPEPDARICFVWKGLADDGDGLMVKIVQCK